MNIHFFEMKPTLLAYLPEFIRSFLEGRPTLQKIINNAGWLFVDHVLRMGVGIFVGVWVARYLGPEQFGALNFAIAFVALFGALANLGLEGIVVRDIVRDRAACSEILGSAFLIKLLGGILGLTLSLLTIFLLRPADSQSHWLVGIIAMGMIFQSLDTVDLWFKSQIQAKFTVWVRNAAFLIIAVVKVVLILKHASLEAFAWAGLGEIIIGAGGLALAYQWSGNSLRAWQARLARVKELLRDSWPLILSSIMVLLYLRIDQVMLGEMVDNKSVGIYSAATRLSEIWYFIPMIIASSVFPSIVKSKSLGEKAYQERIQSYYDLNACIAYLLAIPTSIFAPIIIYYIYGDSYAGADQIFSISIWASLFVFLGVARGQYLVNEGMMKFSLFCTSIGAITNILLNIILIPRYQGIGAAIATLVSYAISSYFTSFLRRSLYHIGFMQTKAFLFPIRALLSSIR